MSEMHRVTWNLWGIINPYGAPWTSKVFDTQGEAKEYLRSQWIGTKEESRLKDFSIERVLVTIERVPQDKVNLHDELVEALKDAKKQIEALCSSGDVPDSVRAALSRARGEKGGE